MTNKPPFAGEGARRVRLGELISKAKTERCGDRSFPVLSMTMHDGIIAQSERFKKAIASKDVSSYKVVYPGQLVVGFPIDEGVIYVQGFDKSGIMSPAYNVWDIDASIVFPGYLELALHGPSCMAYYADKMRGTTARRRTLTSDNLTAMSIPLPDFSQQKRIVDIFGTVRAQMNVCRRQFSLFDNLVKSRFVEMFGDGSFFNHMPLLACVRAIESGRSPKCESYPRKGTRPGVLKLSGISSGSYLEHENKALPLEEPFLKEKEIAKGDILLARKNTPELVGRCVLVHKTAGNIMFPDIVFRMHPNDNVDGTYLSHLLGGPYLDKVRSLAHGSAKSMSNIPKRELAQMSVPLPPISLQREFAAFVSEVDKSRVVVQKQIERLQTLYDSLAQEYFG